MRFSVLDALRGLCALIIVFYHIEIIGSIYDGHLHGFGLIDHGFFFVDFFFVLSGFVLTHSYFLKIGEPKNIASFMIRRFGRVYPLHIVVLMAYVGLELVKLYLYSRGIDANIKPFTHFYSIKGLITNVFLIQALGINDVPTWNTPSWSISTEFYTYILFAFFAYALARKNRALVSLVALAIAFASACILLTYSPKYIDTIYDYAIFRCLYGFFLGVVANFVYRKIGHLPAIISLPAPVFTLLEGTIVAIVVCFVSYTSIEPSSLLAPPLFFVAILIFSMQKGWISRLLTAAPFQFGGKISYTIYITHALLIILFERVVNVLNKKGILHHTTFQNVNIYGHKVDLISFGSPYISDLIDITIVGCVIMLSSFMFHIMEEPGRTYFNTLSIKLFPHRSSGTEPMAGAEIAQPALSD